MSTGFATGQPADRFPRPQIGLDVPLIDSARAMAAAAPPAEPEPLERERKALQADLAALSSRCRVRFAPQSGHNIHLEDPAFVVAAIHELVSGSNSEHSGAIHGR